jgi:SAM-dependent methyltransferase
MNQFLRGVARSIAESFVLPEPILEVGSLQVDADETLINLRSLFPQKRYIGLDFRAGPGVDCVASVEALPQATGSIGTVVAFSAFEHVQHFWTGFEEVYRVLRPDGVFVVACPFYFHQHAYPSDYWRFTPQALELLLETYPTRILGWHGPARREANVWAAAFREQAVMPTPQQFEQYQRLLDEHAREPLPWTRRLKYRIGRVLCGRRPFAPHLDRENWETVLQANENLAAISKAA